MPSELFQQSDDASKYRHPFKRPCHNFFFRDLYPPPPPTRSAGFAFRPPLVNLVPEATTTTGKKKGGGLNGPCYVAQILQCPLKDFLDTAKEEEGQEVLVVEDGAPCHRSAVAKNVQRELGITKLEHPPSSPDLNPIEPLWLILKIM